MRTTLLQDTSPGPQGVHNKGAQLYECTGMYGKSHTTTPTFGLVSLQLLNPLSQLLHALLHPRTLATETLFNPCDSNNQYNIILYIHESKQQHIVNSILHCHVWVWLPKCHVLYFKQWLIRITKSIKTY